MSYVRPYSLQPKELRLTALESWLKHVFRLIRDNMIIMNSRSFVATPSPSLDHNPLFLDDFAALVN